MCWTCADYFMRKSGIEPKAVECRWLSKVGVKERERLKEKAASGIREKWNLGLNPIPNVHSMLENNGVKVKLFDDAPVGFDGLSAFAEADGDKIPTLALARKTDLPRQRLTALHELAHLILELPEDMERLRGVQPLQATGSPCFGTGTDLHIEGGGPAEAFCR